jgi:hypothetical protein
MSESELGYFLRERGLHSEHLKLWDQKLKEYIDYKKNNNDNELMDLKKRDKQFKKVRVVMK